MSEESNIAADLIGEEYDATLDDMVIHDDFLNEAGAPTVESDVSPHSPTTQTEPTPPRESGKAAAPVSRRPDPITDFDAYLDEADIGELETLASKIAQGQIPIATPPAQPIDDGIDPMTDDLPDSVAKSDPVEMPVGGEEAPAPTGIEKPGSANDEPARGPKVKVRLDSEDDRAIVRIAKDEGISILEAAQRVLAEKRAATAEAIDDLVEIPEQSAKPAAAPTPTEKPADLPFGTVAEAEAAIYDLETQADEAQFQEYDDQKAFELRKQLRDLKRQMPAIQRHEETVRTRQLETATAEYDRVWQESEAKAYDIFPELANADDPIHAEMQRLDQEAKVSNVALYGSPTKFFDLAVEARRALAKRGIAPSRSPMSAAPVAPVPIPVSPPRANPAARGVSASPVARATPSAPAAPRLEQRIDEVADVDDLEDLYASLNGRR